LLKQGKMQESLDLYAQSLYTLQSLGDVHGIAATHVSMSQALVQVGEYVQALVLIWNAYTSLMTLGFVSDIQTVQRILVQFKAQDLGCTRFDQIWQVAIREPQPDWLRDVSSDGEDADDTTSFSDETQQALLAYLNAKDWAATRQVLETRQKLLFQPVIEQIFASNIQKAQDEGNQDGAEFLKQYLLLLLICKRDGIAAAFKQLEQGDSGSDEDAWPFPPELIEQSAAALLGSAQEKMVYMQSLMGQMAQTTDEQLKALLGTIQLALFSPDLAALGGDLDGVYGEAWRRIVALVEAGGGER
jgi:hypothetical protein